MNGELATRIWNNAEFQLDLRRARLTWLRRELRLTQPGVQLDEHAFIKLMRAATILARTADDRMKAAAFTAVACVLDLHAEAWDGLPGLMRVVLTSLGNFPVMDTSETVSNFVRLPTSLAALEATRRDANSISVGAGTQVVTDFQIRTWKHLYGGRHVAISAPTSGGKSFVLQTYLCYRLSTAEVFAACYLVPSRALVTEVADSISGALKRDGVFAIVRTMSVPADDVLPTRVVYVLTQERLQSLLSNHPELNIDVLVCDEAHGLRDGARGALLQTVVERTLNISTAAQCVFAGPRIKNLGIFASTFRLLDVVEAKLELSPVIQNVLSLDLRPATKGKIEISRLDGAGAREPVAEADMGRSMPSVREKIVWCAHRFGKHKPSLVYASGPAEAEAVARDIAELRRAALEEGDEAERAALGDLSFASRSYLEDLANLVRNHVHQAYDLAECLSEQVGYHYGYVPSLVRRAIEVGFAAGHLRYLVTTSTLIQGVNFPAANLFMCHPKKGSTDPLDGAEFWNLAGRAGRMGREFQGNVFLVDYADWPEQLASESPDLDVVPALTSSILERYEDIIRLASNLTRVRETEEQRTLDSALSRLLSEHRSGTILGYLDSIGMSPLHQAQLVTAVREAEGRVSLPDSVLTESPSVSVLRQQALYEYFVGELRGGGVRRLIEMMPLHPRDKEAYRALCEVYRICDEQILCRPIGRAHLRLAAISVQWMRGAGFPEIIEASRKHSGTKKIGSVIRETLRDIEREVRFSCVRMMACYSSVYRQVLTELKHFDYVDAVPSLSGFLEVGASDKTMVSLMTLGLSRITARELNELSANKEMSVDRAIRWLRRVRAAHPELSRFVQDDLVRVLRDLAPANGG